MHHIPRTADARHSVSTAASKRLRITGLHRHTGLLLRGESCDVRAIGEVNSLDWRRRLLRVVIHARRGNVRSRHPRQRRRNCSHGLPKSLALHAALCALDGGN